jgi:hypothetical protein
MTASLALPVRQQWRHRGDRQGDQGDLGCVLDVEGRLSPNATSGMTTSMASSDRSIRPGRRAR